MSGEKNESAVLQVRSLKELLGHEKEIVRRINARHKGGHLLLIHPQRLFREIGVELTTEGVKELQEAHPEFFASGEQRAYDMVAKSEDEGAVRVTVSGLFSKATS
jgi:hypothetical protein